MAACSCKSYNVWYTIQNRSGEEIFYSTSTLYPDTSIHFGYMPNGESGAPNSIGPGQQFRKLAPMTLDGYFSTIPSGRLEIFIYDGKVFRTTSPDSMAKKYLILRRYELTEDSIKKLNGVITYP